MQNASNFKIAKPYTYYKALFLRNSCKLPHYQNGISLGRNFKVNQDSVNIAFSSPSISSDNDGDFIITWKEGVDIWDTTTTIFGQKYNSIGERIGDNFIIAETNYLAGVNAAHETKLRNGRIYTTWTDNRGNGTGYDILANVLDWNNPSTDIKLQDEEEITIKFSLSQNYPNPFNPSTTISYSIPQNTHPLIPSREGKERSDRGVLVTLKVYDILGREIVTLVKQKPGNYEVLWDAHEQSSGVYFYQINAGEFIYTRKMILLR